MLEGANIGPISVYLVAIWFWFGHHGHPLARVTCAPRLYTYRRRVECYTLTRRSKKTHCEEV